jgi:hypothetical protein
MCKQNRLLRPQKDRFSHKPRVGGVGVGLVCVIEGFNDSRVGSGAGMYRVGLGLRLEHYIVFVR